MHVVWRAASARLLRPRPQDEPVRPRRGAGAAGCRSGREDGPAGPARRPAGRPSVFRDATMRSCTLDRGALQAVLAADRGYGGRTAPAGGAGPSPMSAPRTADGTPRPAGPPNRRADGPPNLPVPSRALLRDTLPGSGVIFPRSVGLAGRVGARRTGVFDGGTEAARVCGWVDDWSGGSCSTGWDGDRRGGRRAGAARDGPAAVDPRGSPAGPHRRRPDGRHPSRRRRPRPIRRLIVPGASAGRTAPGRSGASREKGRGRHSAWTDGAHGPLFGGAGRRSSGSSPLGTSRRDALPGSGWASSHPAGQDGVPRDGSVRERPPRPAIPSAEPSVPRGPHPPDRDPGRPRRERRRPWITPLPRGRAPGRGLPGHPAAASDTRPIGIARVPAAAGITPSTGRRGNRPDDAPPRGGMRRTRLPGGGWKASCPGPPSDRRRAAPHPLTPHTSPLTPRSPPLAHRGRARPPPYPRHPRRGTRDLSGSTENSHDPRRLNPAPGHRSPADWEQMAA